MFPARSGALRIAAALGAVLLAPWACRLLSLLDQRQGISAADWRGFAADAGAALLCLALVWLLAALSRWLAVASAVLLALAYYANSETIAALGTVASPLDLSFFADPTFVGGSVLALSHPLVLAALLVGTLVLAAWGVSRRPFGDVALALCAGGFVLAALSLAGGDPALATWRQVNALVHNAEWLVLRQDAARGGGYASSARAIIESEPSLAADLAAPPRFALDGRRKNVLLVILESVSGNYLPTATAAHGRDGVNRMHNLDAAFAGNVGYASFFTHQRRTNRGLYTLLCGEYPRLTAGMPKMTVAAARPWQRCLPEILRDHGYHTVYLQSAPLAFMLKDRFMPAIGFDETLGHDSFERAYLRTLWGVDDRAFLEAALVEIERLRARGEPWFLTLLTVGSHHPFVVPESFESPYQTDFRRAFAYLDVAVARFLHGLEKSGMRDDTLVLITSDESAGDLGQVSDTTAGILSQNWGFLVAMTPERSRGLVTEPFAQSDVALSILDYLGLGESGAELFGRSVFRSYDRGRRLFFGNVNHRTLGGIRPDGSLVQCELEGLRCARYATEAGRFFAPSLPRTRAAPGFEEQIREVARRSRPPRDDAPLTIPLLTNPVFEVRKRERQMVQGISQLALEPNEWIEVELVAEARGEGRVELVHNVELSKKRKPLRTTTRLDAGQTLHLRYAFASDLPISQSRVKTTAKLLEGDAVDLLFHRRRFVLRRNGERPAQGVHLELYSLAPPSGDPQALSPQIVPIQEFAGFLEARERRGMQDDDEGGDVFD
ncbi:MAG: LTA synthase family protein [Deltaproteobacteria bacterium]|nr:LTA synthase family protein [Deltaproteobacteria bacterium]MBW2362530.1 LTA synthase family protein [Deltaproteobacteria bacterium]